MSPAVLYFAELLGKAEVHVVGRVQADTGVPVLLAVPGEELGAPRPGVIERSETPAGPATPAAPTSCCAPEPTAASSASTDTPRGLRRRFFERHNVPDAEGSRPAVVFVHGGPGPAGTRSAPRDLPTLVGHARLAVAEGMVDVTLDHRLHDVADYERAPADVAATVELVRADPRVDADRVAL